MLRLHDEVIGVGDLRRTDDIFLTGVVYTEGDVIIEGVIKQNGFLIDIADELTKIVDAEILDIDAVDKHFAFLHVVIARNEVDQR